ncbi:MAG: type IX secretion system protein PorQ [Bacteroidales bacterium]|nr:type IX secretion system protein PorQ [Bacteroidales bacterium]
MLKKFIVAFIVLLFVLPAMAQTGGGSVYNFLNYSYSTRQMALGGGLISVHDEDPTLIILNPSSISDRHSNALALDFTNYFASTNYASALYSYTFPKAGSFAAELRYVGYGQFQGTDESGMETSNFTAGDYALTLGWGRELTPNFSIGANLKMIFCSYERYSSFGLAVDVAGSYYNPDKQLSLTLLAKNIGSELKTFAPGNFEKTPFDLQFALSQRLQHVPIRYHLSLHSLYRWNMNYYGSGNPFLETDVSTNQIVYPTKTKQFFDNFFRHIIFGLEIEPSQYFSLQLAYNHDVHQSMKVLARHSLAGFSYGFMINVRSIQFGFSRQHFAPGATPNCFNLAMNFDELSKLHQEKKAKKLTRN